MSAGRNNSRGGRLRFSLGNMLTFTAIIAVWIANGLSLRKSNNLRSQRSALMDLSRRLVVLDSDRIQTSAYPRIADDFTTWEVHIPNNDSFELRFGIGQVSDRGMPQAFEKFALQPGRHRISLHAADSVNEGYHFTAFVDGQSVFHPELERDWMPNGWNQASSLNVPVGPTGSPLVSVQLKGTHYTPSPSPAPP